MAQDLVSLWNRALSSAGGRGSVSDPDNDTNREAILCRLWYPLVRNIVQKAAPWPACKTVAQLALRATRDTNSVWNSTIDPGPTWRYAYSEPSDLLQPRYLQSFARFERLVFQDSPAILANETNSILYYNRLVEDVAAWDSGLDYAVTSLLTAKLSVPLSGKRTLAEDNFGYAQQAISEMQTSAANEQPVQATPMPIWLQARGYEGEATRTVYIHPYENLNVLAP